MAEIDLEELWQQTLGQVGPDDVAQVLQFVGDVLSEAAPLLPPKYRLAALFAAVLARAALRSIEPQLEHTGTTTNAESAEKRRE